MTDPAEPTKTSLYDYTDKSVPQAGYAAIAYGVISLVTGVFAWLQYLLYHRPDQGGFLHREFANQQWLQHTPLITGVAVVFSVIIAAISGVLAFRIFRRSRGAIIAMLIFVIMLQLYIWFVARSVAGTLVTIILSAFCCAALDGRFRIMRNVSWIPRRRSKGDAANREPLRSTFCGSAIPPFGCVALFTGSSRSLIWSLVRCFDISSMQDPPPRPRKKSRAWLWILLVIGGLSIATLIGGIVAYRSIIASGITRSFDNKFGDQHLKTAVALIELHKVRFARYPDSLRDLKFTGEWDQIALMSVRYYPSAKRDAYYIEVERGWMGKPTFTMPPEFWSGTGYSAALRPASQ